MAEGSDFGRFLDGKGFLGKSLGGRNKSDEY